MDVEDVKKEKRILEMSIRTAICHFQDKTGTVVDGVNLYKIEVNSVDEGPKSLLSNVYIDAKL